MRHVDPEVVEMITSMSSVRNTEEVFFIFGLSYNTLRQLSAGLPIRRSLADRIEERARPIAESEKLCIVAAYAIPTRLHGLACLQSTGRALEPAHRGNIDRKRSS